MKYLHEYTNGGLSTGRYCLTPDPLPDSCFIIYEPLITINGNDRHRLLPLDKPHETLVEFEEFLK